MFMLLTQNSVSSNSFDFSFDGINVIDGLNQLSEFFRNLPNYLPSFARVGTIFGYALDCFPSKFWFCIIFVLICLTIGRIMRRF